MTNRVGQQLGNYRLSRLLGTGGFADVYLGEQMYLKTLAAIKVLQTQLVDDERERFLQEARIIARVIHPHIVRVLEFGVEGDVPFLVMDYAPGGTLRLRHRQGTMLSPLEILPYVMQVASALQYAHDHRLIHRDVKPENMLLGRSGEVLLGDFGIALITQSTRSQGTQEVFGTASYMAPEQIQGKAEPASDQYALGVVIYEWLCGTLPFHGSFTEVCSQHLFTPPPPLHEQVSDIPPAIEAVVEKALAKDPGSRYSSIESMATAFEESCQREEVALLGAAPTVRRSSTSLPAASYAPTQYVEETTHTPEEASLPETEAAPTPQLPDLPASPTSTSSEKQGISRRLVIAGIGLAALATAGGLTILNLSSHRATEPGPKPSPPSHPQFTAPPSPTVTAAPESQGATLLTYHGHTGAVYALSWSPNGLYMASASADTTVRVWNTASGDTLYTYRGHAGLYNGVFAVGWASDGSRIASGGADKTVQIWDAATGNQIVTYHGHTARVLALSWSPDRRFIASGGADKTVQIWDAITGLLIFTYHGHTHTVYTLEWSPDGKSIASGGADKTVQIWNATTGLHISSYHGHTNTVYTLAWSPDGKTMLSGGADRTIQTWDATTGKTISTYHGPTGLTDSVTSASWSPDGNTIASGSTNKTVQVWDTITNKLTSTYRGHHEGVFVVEWSPSGQHVASGSADTTVRIWQAL